MQETVILYSDMAREFQRVGQTLNSVSLDER